MRIVKHRESWQIFYLEAVFLSGEKSISHRDDSFDPARILLRQFYFGSVRFQKGIHEQQRRLKFREQPCLGRELDDLSEIFLRHAREQGPDIGEPLQNRPAVSRAMYA